MRIALGLLTFLILAISCGDTHEDGPTAIYYGEDICERCKMIISEKKFVAQYKSSDGKTVKFDDMGCMIHYMDGEKPEHIESIYVMDYDSGEWTDAEIGYFIWTETVNTPMGYGILSFDDKKIAALKKLVSPKLILQVSLEGLEEHNDHIRGKTNMPSWRLPSAMTVSVNMYVFVLLFTVFILIKTSKLPLKIL